MVLTKLLIDEAMASERRNDALEQSCGDPSQSGWRDDVDTVEEILSRTKDPTDPWRDAVERIETPVVRFVYVPTAMLALRSDSSCTPGKQRQRARSDAKKRRSKIVDALTSLLGDEFTILALSLDFADGSVKQTAGSQRASDFPTVS